MFVYYKLYREPVSPTILTPLCGDQEKKRQYCEVEVVHENVRSVRLLFFFFF